MTAAGQEPDRPASARPASPAAPLFEASLAVCGLPLLVLIVAIVFAVAAYTSPSGIVAALSRPEIRHAAVLTSVSSTIAAAAAVCVATPLGYLLTRRRFPGAGLVEAVLDVPHVLPPLVLGLGLLILFQTATPRWIAAAVVYEPPAVLIAQFVVAATIAVPVLRAAFERTDPRIEAVAMTLGCGRAEAFRRVVLPEVRDAIVAAAALAWARCFGSFGPLLVFAGATRNKTEVLATSVFLELGTGDLEAAAAVSLVMIAVAVGVLTVARFFLPRPGIDPG